MFQKAKQLPDAPSLRPHSSCMAWQWGGGTSCSCNRPPSIPAVPHTPLLHQGRFVRPNFTASETASFEGLEPFCLISKSCCFSFRNEWSLTVSLVASSASTSPGVRPTLAASDRTESSLLKEEQRTAPQASAAQHVVASCVFPGADRKLCTSSSSEKASSLRTLCFTGTQTVIMRGFY